MRAYELVSELKKNNTSTNPALSVGATTSTVAGLLSLILYFFPEIPDSTIQTILVISAFLLPIIGAFATRGFVWSPASVQTVVDEAVKQALEAAKKPDLKKFEHPEEKTGWTQPDKDKPPFNE